MAQVVATLEEPRDEHAVLRARNARRVALAVLAAIVLAGLAGFLGIRTSTAVAAGEGYEMRVTHAQVTRAGIAVPLRVEVRRHGGFDGPVHLAFSAALLERFDFQNFYPNPSAETADPDLVRYEFDPPPGDVFRVSLDGRTAPDQNGSVGTYSVHLEADGRVVAAVEFRMIVVP